MQYSLFLTSRIVICTCLFLLFASLFHLLLYTPFSITRHTLHTTFIPHPSSILHHPSSTIHHPSYAIQISKLPADDSLASEDTDGDVKKDIVPFVEFQKMFSEFQEKNEALGLTHLTAQSQSPPPVKTSRRDSRMYLGRNSVSGGSLRTARSTGALPSERKDPSSLKGSGALGINVDSDFDAVGYLANEDPLLASFLKMKLDVKDNTAARRMLNRSNQALMKAKSKRLFGVVGLGAVTLEPLGEGGLGQGQGRGTFMTSVKGLPKFRGRDMASSGFTNIFKGGWLSKWLIVCILT
jgi:hypothetical protein